MKIVFTGHGPIAEAFCKRYDASMYSFREMDEDSRKNIISSNDVIIHNAANINGRNPQELMRDNFLFTRDLIKQVIEIEPMKKFIYIGSMSYLHEEGYISIEKMTPYAMSKFFGEIYVITNLVNSKIIRFSTIFFKDKDRDGISKIIYSAYQYGEITLYNSGSGKRDIIPLDIAIQYLYSAINAEKEKIINICSGHETTFFQLGRIIERKLGCRINFEDAQMPYVLSKFKRRLPEISFSLEDEISDYIKHLRG